MKKLILTVLTFILIAAMTLPSFAAVNFTPSVEADKPAPELEEIVVDGVPYAAIAMETETGTIYLLISFPGGELDADLLELYRTALSEKESAIIHEITDALNNANGQLVKVDDLGDLAPGMEEKIQAKIDAFFGAGSMMAKDIFPRMTALKFGGFAPLAKVTSGLAKPKVEELVVTDVFNLTLVRNRVKYEEIKLPAGVKFTFIIVPNFTPDDFFVLLHNPKDAEWEVMDDVSWTQEGHIKVMTESLANFVIVRDPQKALPYTPGKDSPTTDIGTGFRFEYVAVAVAFVGLAAFFFVMARRRKEF